MSIQGVQIIYRLKQIVRLFIDYRDSVDFFNLYYSDSESGTYYELGSAVNKPSSIPASKGKIVFEFNSETLEHWVSNARNYIKLAPVTNSSEGALEGPLIIPTREESVVPKEYSIIFGYNKENNKFLPVSVDVDGKLITS